MNFLRALFKIAAWMLGLLLGGIGLYIGYAHWAWADLTPAEIAQRHPLPELQVAMVDGVPLHYQLQGPADAPTIVLIHNHFMDMGMWDSWVQGLREAYQVLRYDLSGHGRTGPDPSGIYTVERDVALLQGLLDSLGIHQAHIVGSSLGGNVAFGFVATQPERSLSLALINSGGMPRENNRAEGEIPPIADQIMPLLPPAAYRAFLQWMAVNDVVLTEKVQQRFVDMFRREGNRAAELSRLRQYEVRDPRPLLAQVRVPSLVLWGAENPQLPAALAQEFAAALVHSPSVNLRVIPEAGHILPLEQAEQSLQAYTDFLAAPAR